jgi:hypothetical protein
VSSACPEQTQRVEGWLKWFQSKITLCRCHLRTYDLLDDIYIRPYYTPALAVYAGGREVEIWHLTPLRVMAYVSKISSNS